MSVVTWSFPTTIVFGLGSVGRLGELTRKIGGARALLVTDPGVVRAGVAERARRALESGNIACAVYDGVHGNPLEQDVLGGVDAYRLNLADVVVAVGGGAALDVAKLVALKVTHAGQLADYDDAAGGEARITPNVPPIVTVPTTAGTGSEVGRAGVVTLRATGRKTVIFSPHLLARVAVLDPELTSSVPPRVTAATGFDALTHCVEAYLATGEHPMADAIALGGIELVAKHLERAVRHGADLEARAAMMKAAMMGAVAFQKGLGVCHSLAHPLSSERDMHHGLANALCLPAVIDFNNAVVPERVERIRRLLDVSATSLPNALRALRERVGLPSGLSAEGLKKADVPALADKAVEDACHRTNPRPATREDLIKLYEASL